MGSLKEDHKEFIKSTKLILKSQQNFWSERHSVFTEEINKIILSSNDDNRLQSIDPVETYARGSRKNLISKQEKIKCDYMIKQYKKWLTLMMLQKKP